MMKLSRLLKKGYSMRIDSLEDQVNKLFGVEKASAESQLIQKYLSLNFLTLDGLQSKSAMKHFSWMTPLFAQISSLQPKDFNEAFHKNMAVTDLNEVKQISDKADGDLFFGKKITTIRDFYQKYFPLVADVDGNVEQPLAYAHFLKNMGQARPGKYWFIGLGAVASVTAFFSAGVSLPLFILANVALGAAPAGLFWISKKENSTFNQESVWFKRLWNRQGKEVRQNKCYFYPL